MCRLSAVSSSAWQCSAEQSRGKVGQHSKYSAYWWSYTGDSALLASNFCDVIVYCCNLFCQQSCHCSVHVEVWSLWSYQKLLVLVNDIEYQCKFCTAKAKVCVWVSTALCSMVVSPLVVVSSAPWAMFCLCLDNCFLSQTCNRQTIKIRSPICQLVVQGAKQTTKNPFSLVFFLVHKM